MQQTQTKKFFQGITKMISVNVTKTTSTNVTAKTTLNFPHCSISAHPLYQTWQGMRDRCKNYGSITYKHYGLRGIKVCERWDKSFFHFVSDMGMKPGAEYSLDRIDNDENYTPDNCRWATSKEQNNNKRTNRRITFDGQTRNITDWAKYFDISLSTLNGLSQQYGLNTAMQILKKYS